MADTYWPDAVATQAAVLRDQARTIAELRTEVERLGLDLELIRAKADYIALTLRYDTSWPGLVRTAEEIAKLAIDGKDRHA